MSTPRSTLRAQALCEHKHSATTLIRAQASKQPLGRHGDAQYALCVGNPTTERFQGGISTPKIERPVCG